MIRPLYPLALSLALAGLCAPAVLATRAAPDPFGRDPADPVSSFAMRDKAGNLQLHMVVPGPDADRREGERCMPGTALCFSVNEADTLDRVDLVVRQFNPPGSAQRTSMQSLSLPIELKEDTDLAIWPLAVRRVGGEQRDVQVQGEALLIGILATDRVGYSGGGGSRTMLWLYKIDNAGASGVAGSQVMSLLHQSGQLIRACFNDRDARKRRGACHDETQVETTLILDPENTGAMPRLVYRTAARTWPGATPRLPPEETPDHLRKSDLVWSSYPQCSYARGLWWNPATNRYAFDNPVPDCNSLGWARP